MSGIVSDRPSAYEEMMRVARRVTASESEAYDLVQDTILIALERGIEDWESPCHRAWLKGVVRKRSAFVIRTSRRRRRREEGFSATAPEQRGWRWNPEFLRQLPRSLRSVAQLANADLSGREIRWLLGLSSAAFRTRLSALSRRVRAELDAPIEESTRPLETFGISRTRILRQLKALPDPTMGTHDPDGHVLFFKIAAHKRADDGNS